MCGLQAEHPENQEAQQRGIRLQSKTDQDLIPDGPLATWVAIGRSLPPPQATRVHLLTPDQNKLHEAINFGERKKGFIQS